jgi:hypothetical protein
MSPSSARSTILTSKPPYITANALIRYCFAKAPERSRIIRDFRDNPFPPFKGWYGGETEGAIRRFIGNGGTDEEPLVSLEKALMVREAVTDHDEDKIQGQLHALEAMREVDLSKVVRFGNPSAINDTLAPWFVSGVRVSVRPTNVILVEKVGQKAPAVGLVRPYLASSDPLSDDAGQLHAALLHWYAEETMAHLGVTDPRICFAIDVFKGTVFQAPTSYKQRRDLLEHSCQEIYERWSSGSSTAQLKKA